MGYKSVVSRSQTIVHWFREALFPVFCLRCGREGFWLCSTCEAQAPEVTIQRCVFCGDVSPHGQTCPTCSRRHALSGVTVRGRYGEWRWAPLIQAWKYGSARDIDETIVRLFLPGLLSLPNDKPDVCVPVPLTRRRARDRGFNQAEVLALIASKAIGVPVVEPLKRTRHTAPQARLTADERKANMQNAFVCVEPALVKDKYCLLVDDVVTTGTTLEEAAKVLKAAGARAVWAVAIARSDIE